MKINAGIVTLNPNISVLYRNIKAITHQVDSVVVVDNGSVNLDEIKSILDQFQNVELICNYKNFGIARALNMIMKWSEINGGVWTLTLDQDSECSESIIQMYMSFPNNPDTGMLTCKYIDRNIKNENYVESGNKWKEVDFCITSASLLKNECWKEVGGFDEYMFIDKVDNDICLKLKQKGYSILCVNDIGFTHEVGKAKEVTFWGKKCIVYNHSPFRRYFIARNTLYVSKKYKNVSFFYELLHVLFYTIVLLVYEDQKLKKFFANIRGIIVGALHYPREINYSKTRINFVLPSIQLSGGVQVVLRYAQLLSKRGNDVKIYVPVWAYLLKEENIKNRICQVRNTLGKAYHLWVKKEYKSLMSGENIIPIWRINKKDVRDAEYSIATAWPTANDVNVFGEEKGKKIYFVQDYEIWDKEDVVKKTYELPYKKIVISKWINEMLISQGVDCGTIVHNGVDCNEFYPETEEIDNNNEKIQCLMLYHKLGKKGVADGIAAFEYAKKKINQLSLELFGMEEPYFNCKYVFHKSPSRSELRKLYSRAKIFIFPSKNEGWGLTPIEAMACRCAVVGTNTGCMIDIGVDGKNALIVSPEDIIGMGESIITLATYRDFREKISQAGYKTAINLDWKIAASRFEECLWGEMVYNDNQTKKIDTMGI